MTSLRAVRSALGSFDSQHAAFLTSLIETGKLSPYRSQPESLTRLRFGSSEHSFPQLGRKISPFASDMAESVQKVIDECLRDLKETSKQLERRLMYIASSDSLDDARYSSDEDTAPEIIRNLDTLGAGLDTIKHIIAFQSEALEDMRRQDSEEPDNILHTSMTMLTILPSSTLLSLQHSNEGNTVASLISGLVLWVIWPPTRHNLSALQTAYGKFAEDGDEEKLEISQHLEGGIIFLQSEGEGLQIPPFCPMMSVSLEPSVLVTYSTVTIDNLISTIQRAPFLEAFFKTELNGECKQKEFSATVLRWLGALLNGEMDPDTQTLDETYRIPLSDDGPLSELLRSWDSLKDDMASMVGPANAELVANIWSKFLIECKGRQCRLCGKRIQNKQKLMRKHFVSNHWPKVIPSECLDFTEVNDQENNEGEPAMEVLDTADTMQEF